MNFRMVHNNINVADLRKSMDFYREALGLEETERIEGEGFTIVYLGNDQAEHKLELTCLDAHPEKYNLGENEFHLAFETDDYDNALAKHREMDCVIFENDDMGIYFIVDPDGYWLEIIPADRSDRR